MRFILLFYLSCWTFAAFGQKNSGQSPQSILITEFKGDANLKDSTLLKFYADTLLKEVTLNFHCKKWHLIDAKTLKKVYSFNEVGEQIPDENKVLSGQCFCSSCSKNKRTIQAEQLGDYLIQTVACEGKPEFIFKFKPLPEKKWHEKTWVKGDKINLENLLFYPNKSMFLEESYAELNELFLLLDKQKHLAISIKGHVNGPNHKNSAEFQLLSENRAKAVYDYLIKKGIPASRLTFSGYGNTQMIFPNAQNEEEMKKNRRVEILIL